MQRRVCGLSATAAEQQAAQSQHGAHHQRTASPGAEGVASVGQGGGSPRSARRGCTRRRCEQRVRLAWATPFPWMVDFPARLLAGEPVEAARGFAALLLWALLLRQA